MCVLPSILNKKKNILVLALCSILFCLSGCKEYNASDDPSLRLSFSSDTLSFDTVFTEQGSATMQLMVYNRNESALLIRSVSLDDGKAFQVNIDGEADLSRMTNIQVNGGDSMYVFVRVDIDPLNSNNPVLVFDRLHFHLSSGTAQQVVLEAYGQDVTRFGHPGCGRTEKGDLTMTADKPYLIFDTLVIGGALTIDAGARIYMHNNACIYALGDVTAQGKKEQPILIQGDRLDNLFDSVPYAYAGGSWNGFYLQAEEPHTYDFEYVEILSGNNGLFVLSECKELLPTLRVNGCRIHNHTQYGLALNNVNATVTNTEISNCALYCVYCDGGTHTFTHTTIASYFGYTNIRIQSADKEETAAVYIQNLSKEEPQTNASFVNCIITGYLRNQLVVATPFDQYYTGTFKGNYLKTDTLRMPFATNNTYWQQEDSAVFRKDFYKYKEYSYYDFHLAESSPAIGIGDSIAALPYDTDRDGVSRALMRPDAGCYQHQP